MAHALATLFNSIVNPKRDFVSANTPTDQLLKTFLDMPEGARRSASYETSGGTGQDPGYGWPDLPPAWDEVFSQVPQAEARGELNEETLRDYMEAMNVYNQGGKAERILSLIAGVGTTGGYIADRTSGDPERRRMAGGPGGDLDYALQNIFALPNQMNQKRRDEMTSAMGWADTQRSLRGESLGAMSTAKGQDNYWNYMFRQAGAKAGEQKARISGSTPRIPMEEKEYYKAKKFLFGAFRKKYPDLPHRDLLDKFIEEYPDLASHYTAKSPYLKNYVTPGKTYSDWDADADKAWYQQYGKEWENAEGDDDKRKQMLNEKISYKRQWITDRIRWEGKEVDPNILDEIFPPAQPGDEVTEEEGRGFFDVLGDAAGGAYEGGKEGGLLDMIGGGLKGLFGMDEDTAQAVEGVSGEQRVPEGQIIEEDSRGWLMKRPDGSEEWVRKPRTGAQEEERSQGVDLTEMMRLIGAIE